MPHPLMQFFAYAHLPAHLQEISKPFGELAEVIAALPSNSESTTALRKLLEAKDCAVRAKLMKMPDLHTGGIVSPPLIPFGTVGRPSPAELGGYAKTAAPTPVVNVTINSDTPTDAGLIERIQAAVRPLTTGEVATWRDAVPDGAVLKAD